MDQALPETEPFQRDAIRNGETERGGARRIVVNGRSFLVNLLLSLLIDHYWPTSI